MILGRRTLAAVLALVVTTAALVAWRTTPAAGAGEYRPITGSGSSWSAWSFDQWTADVRASGLQSSYSAVGSIAGRNEFRSGTVDFAVSEIPYGLTGADGVDDAPPDRPFTYVPVVAGGTAFAYDLKVAGRRVTDLRLSGEAVTRVFTGRITRWNDPVLLQENPGIALPDLAITRVVRAESSGSTRELTAWMSSEHPGLWDAYCAVTGIDRDGGCEPALRWPQDPGVRAQSGSMGVVSAVASSGGGAITYVENAYALRANLPVAKVLNSSGFHVAPTHHAVSIALLSARVDADPAAAADVTQLQGVYRSTDPRSYPLSAYASAIIPTAELGGFTAAKGPALGDFLRYAVCEGQQSSGALGNAPLPRNLVQVGMERLRSIPGATLENLTVHGCGNPTLGPGGESTVQSAAPHPPACDRAGPTQCGSGGGTVATPPVVVLPAVAGVEGLMRELAATTPGLTVAEIDRGVGTFTVPTCELGAVPLPASPQDDRAMLAGLEYGSVAGGPAGPLPSSCRPSAVTTAPGPSS